MVRDSKLCDLSQATPVNFIKFSVKKIRKIRKVFLENVSMQYFQYI